MFCKFVNLFTLKNFVSSKIL